MRPRTLISLHRPAPLPPYTDALDAAIAAAPTYIIRAPLTNASTDAPAVPFDLTSLDLPHHPVGRAVDPTLLLARLPEKLAWIYRNRRIPPPGMKEETACWRNPGPDAASATCVTTLGATTYIYTWKDRWHDTYTGETHDIIEKAVVAGASVVVLSTGAWQCRRYSGPGDEMFHSIDTTIRAYATALRQYRIPLVVLTPPSYEYLNNTCVRDVSRHLTARGSSARAHAIVVDRQAFLRALPAEVAVEGPHHTSIVSVPMAAQLAYLLQSVVERHEFTACT